MQAQINCTFTSSLMFRSAPWLLRALTTSRLPPLQAQWMALEPSWKTVGGPNSINYPGIRPLEAGALLCKDNFVQSHHHVNIIQTSNQLHSLLDLWSWYRLPFLKAPGLLQCVLPERHDVELSSSAGKMEYFRCRNYMWIYICLQ